MLKRNQKKTKHHCKTAMMGLLGQSKTKRIISCPGQVAQSVRASSQCAKIARFNPSSGHINKWNNKSMFVSFSLFPSLSLKPTKTNRKKKNPQKTRKKNGLPGRKEKGHILK